MGAAERPDAVVNLQTGNDKLATMRGLMAASTFADCLSRRVEQTRVEQTQKPRSAFSLAIKVFVDYETGDQQVDHSTDPELVDCLAEEIGSIGIGAITVFLDRIAGAERYISKLKKKGYTVKGLNEEPRSNDFGSWLGQESIAKAWLEADFRVSFGKVRTSPTHFYDASISNIQFSKEQTSPQRRHANGLRPKRFEQAVLLADRLPLDFGFADAWLSANGAQGTRLMATHTLLASENLLALDWVVGEKMGLDPALNPVIQEAMHRWGILHLIRRGNTTPWDGWKNVAAGAVVWNQLFSADF